MKHRQKRILVFGYFGYVTNQLDGQTVKTRAIFNLIKNHRSADEVSFADSQEFRYSIKSLFKFLADLIFCNTLIWLPAHNNLKYLFPLIYMMSKLCRFEIIYIVIGGWLSVFLEDKPFHRNKLKRLQAILLENNLSVQELQSKYNFSNLDIIPNFREIAPKPEFFEQDGSLKLVFMARVNRMKGLDTIVEVASRIKERDITIDIYGPVFSDDEQYFKTEIVDRFQSIKYCGILQPNEIYKTLIRYDAMLFPTHYYTEGFPGSIMDAYRSALPVIATEWKHAREFVVDRKTGFIVNFEDPVDEIVDAINTIDSDRELLSKMRECSYSESLKYSPDEAWRILEKYLQ